MPKAKGKSGKKPTPYDRKPGLRQPAAPAFVPSGSSLGKAELKSQLKLKASSMGAGSGTLPPLVYRGCRHLRSRLVYSLLSGRTVRIVDIRSLDDRPGLRDYEVSFLRLLDKLSTGTVININTTGTALRFQPGLLLGGAKLTHDCPSSRAIGYFLEAIAALGPFCKRPLAITLTGITNDNRDVSVDVFRTVTLPLLKRFGIDAGLDLKIRKRGAAPEGGGEVLFTCPVVPQLKNIQLTEEGKVKRIRGVAYTTRCSPQIANRLVDAARSVLNNLIPDVYIYTDHYKGKDSGRSPGFALCLVAETTSGCMLSTELAASQHSELVTGAGVAVNATGVQGAAHDSTLNSLKIDLTSLDTEAEVAAVLEEEGQGSSLSPSVGGSGSDAPALPEDLGLHVAKQLCEEISRGGCVDTAHQSLVLLLMALCPEDWSRVRLGPLSQHTIDNLRLMRDFFGVVFKIRSEERAKTAADAGSVLLSCQGIGLKNLARKVI